MKDRTGIAGTCPTVPIAPAGSLNAITRRFCMTMRQGRLVFSRRPRTPAPCPVAARKNRSEMGMFDRGQRDADNVRAGPGGDTRGTVPFTTIWKDLTQRSNKERGACRRFFAGQHAACGAIHAHALPVASCRLAQSPAKKTSTHIRRRRNKHARNAIAKPRPAGRRNTDTARRRMHRNFASS